MKKLILLFTSILILSGCTTQEVAEDITVSVVQASTGRLESSVDIAGVLLPSKTENISAKMSGAVLEINGQVGDKVHTGDLLVTLDAKELEAQLNQAEAAYMAAKDQSEVARATMDAAKVGLTSAQNSVTDQIKIAQLNLDAAKEQLESTEAQSKVQLEQVSLSVENARQNLDRVSKLFASNIVSQADMDAAQNALDMAQSQYNLTEASVQSALLAAQTKVDAAQTQYDQASGSSAQSQIAAAQSQYSVTQKQYGVSSSSTLAQSQSAIDTIRTQLSNANLYATMDGTIVNKYINTGETAAAGSPLITLADLSTLTLKGTVPQEVLPFLKEGAEIDLTVDIYPDKLYKAKISAIGPMAVSTGSYFPIEIDLPNTDGTATAGLTARASINVTGNPRVIIPLSAVVENNGLTYVFVIENNVAKKTTVVLGLRNDQQVEIYDGLTEGDTVAVSQVNTLFDNLPVRLANES